jgi:hypothetical protein
MVMILGWSVPVTAKENIGAITEAVSFRARVPANNYHMETAFTIRQSKCLRFENISASVSINFWIVDNNGRPVEGPHTAWSKEDHPTINAFTTELLEGRYFVRIRPRYKRDLGKTFRVKILPYYC